jgi:hypothetical protein
MKKISNEIAIRNIVKSTMLNYAKLFSERHINEIDNPNGTINMKIHNVFIAALGEEVQYYAALVRSLDSSLGNLLERLAISIAELFYVVHRSVDGVLYPEQTAKIAEFLEAYKNKQNPITADVSHYKELRKLKNQKKYQIKTHVSDYYLHDVENDKHYLIELKIGGDLDNKKARSEKEALFEQYAILSNTLPKNSDIHCYFATAYNRFGEGREWKQARVLQFFSKEELLIGKDFWNFICKSENGYGVIIDEYKKNAHLIRKALDEIKTEYL